MNIIFDLDGTLIDSSERMYRLFQHLVPKSMLSKKEYWHRKRKGVNHQKLLESEFRDIDFAKFNEKWLSLIETSNFLAMDKCYPDTINVLTSLEKTYPLYLLTARQLPDALFRELNSLKLTKYFSDIYVTANMCSKEKLLKRVISDNPNKFNLGDWFISDMGKDILFGNEMGFRTIAISHGFMNKEKLLEYKPLYCIDKLSELETLVCKNSNPASK